MPKETKSQQKTVERVMHSFKQGNLESSAGGKVKDRRQAVAIALAEAGASNNNDRRPSEPTRAELYAQAGRQGIAGRSRMNKEELRRAVAHH